MIEAQRQVMTTYKEQYGADPNDPLGLGVNCAQQTTLEEWIQYYDAMPNMPKEL